MIIFLWLARVCLLVGLLLASFPGAGGEEAVEPEEPGEPEECLRWGPEELQAVVFGPALQARLEFLQGSLIAAMDGLDKLQVNHEPEFDIF